MKYLWKETKLNKKNKQTKNARAHKGRQKNKTRALIKGRGKTQTVNAIKFLKFISRKGFQLGFTAPKKKEKEIR